MSYNATMKQKHSVNSAGHFSEGYLSRTAAHKREHNYNSFNILLKVVTLRFLIYNLFNQIIAAYERPLLVTLETYDSLAE